MPCFDSEAQRRRCAVDTATIDGSQLVFNVCDGGRQGRLTRSLGVTFLAILNEICTMRLSDSAVVKVKWSYSARQEAGGLAGLQHVPNSAVNGSRISACRINDSVG
jgi:hypothetical protein